MSAQKLNIQKERLIELYINKKLSTAKVASYFGCNHVTILNYLKFYNIPRRSRLGNRKSVDITKEALFDLYVNKKLTHKQISEKLGYSRFGIQSKIKLYKIPSRSFSKALTKYPKYDFKNNLIEKAYLTGFRLGDLNVSKVRRLIQVRCSTTKENQITLIKSLFMPYGYVHVWKAKRGTLEVVTLLNTSFTFLLPKSDSVEKWITDDTNIFLSFLAGYSDAEGSYYLRKPYFRSGKLQWPIFEIQTYDKNIISFIHKKLLDIGVENKLTMSRAGGYVDKRGIKTNKDCWRVSICKKQALWNFIKLIEPFHKHEDKLKSLTLAKENLLMRNTFSNCRKIKI